MSRSAALAGLLCTSTLLLDCGDPDKPPYIAADRGVDHGGAPFLSPCTSSSECASAHCLTMAGSQRCARSCGPSDPCPPLANWTCTAQSVCVCKGSGKEPTVCNADGDCDGLPDREVKPEVCNAKDDDCSGKIDDVPAGTEGAEPYYRDVDGDAFGDQNEHLWSCEPLPGYVLDRTDCDDTRKDVHPGMLEACGDNVDHDCDGGPWDSDVCGSLPVMAASVNDAQPPSGVLKTCPAVGTALPRLDITQIVAKQDPSLIRYTMMLAAPPALDSCASYVLRLGSLDKVYDLVYVYRPATIGCAGLPELEAFLSGTKLTSKAVGGFFLGSPGHVSFTIPKTECFAQLSKPSYSLMACTNAKADAVGDITACNSDSCETPVRRE